jgi:uncharacterized repeat protein (TIGR03803 family)
MGRSGRNFLLGCAACVVAASAGENALAARNEGILHDFAYATGKYPGPLAIDPSTGALYGAAEGGGAHGNGVVYQILPPTSTHHRYANSVIYDVPAGFTWNGFVSVVASVVYVTSYQGGTGCASPGCGMVFSLAPPKSGTGQWTPTVLYSFTGGSDGAGPYAPVVGDSHGVLYGTAYAGADHCSGSNGCGTVFTLTPPNTNGQPWTFSVIYRFTGGKAGQNPTGVILDQHGSLYGIASLIGAHPNYLYYKLSPPSGAGEWPETDIYRLYVGSTNCATGGTLAIDAIGALYSAVGGTCDYAFQLAPSTSDPNVWVKTFMHIFNSSKFADGVGVNGPLTADATGNVYGTTYGGGNGAGQGDGTVFVLEPRLGVAGKWNLKVLYKFANASTGFLPNGDLVLDAAGAIYGTTQAGGDTEHGVLFRLSP